MLRKYLQYLLTIFILCLFGIIAIIGSFYRLSLGEITAVTLIIIGVFLILSEGISRKMELSSTAPWGGIVATIGILTLLRYRGIFTKDVFYILLIVVGVIMMIVYIKTRR